jgi:hypothetical protein
MDVHMLTAAMGTAGELWKQLVADTCIAFHVGLSSLSNSNAYPFCTIAFGNRGSDTNNEGLYKPNRRHVTSA